MSLFAFFLATFASAQWTVVSCNQPGPLGRELTAWATASKWAASGLMPAVLPQGSASGAAPQAHG